MTPEYIPAVSALAGSMIGGVTSLTAAWLTQSHQAIAERLTQEKTRRQKLYKDFIEETSRLYADALGHNKAEISDFVKVYALISRMRVLSSADIIDNAEKVVEMIVDTYFAPNKTLTELRGMLTSPAIDPLQDFSEFCRKGNALSPICTARFVSRRDFGVHLHRAFQSAMKVKFPKTTAEIFQAKHGRASNRLRQRLIFATSPSKGTEASGEHRNSSYPSSHTSKEGSAIKAPAASKQ